MTRHSRHLTPASKSQCELSLEFFTEERLVAVARALGAQDVGNLSVPELRLLRGAPTVGDALVWSTKKQILAGLDPLGDAFCQVRNAETRRSQGAIYTPQAIIDSMLSWAQVRKPPVRIVDPGSGSGRFLVAAARRFPKASLLGVETDPLAALIARGTLAAAGVGDRADIIVDDFRAAKLGEVAGPTLYVGNPPYVRHHLIEPEWKAWLKEEAKALGFVASGLAGLHVYFFLTIARRAKPGDYGALITASEWLDVNYGRLVRELFLGRLGGESVSVINPLAEPFPGTLTTGAVTTFSVKTQPPSARFASVKSLNDLGDLSGGLAIRRDRLESENRWSTFIRTAKAIPSGYVELGELCRVHRGQVTGANHLWIEGDHSEGLPEEVFFPTVTRARDLIRAGWRLGGLDELRRVIDLPLDLSGFDGGSRTAIDRFLRRARYLGVNDGYVAQHRRRWWSVGLRPPAPILATYMARRPPSFVLNDAGARHINIAHGLYPREVLSKKILTGLVRFLRTGTTVSGGRVYAGGLTKFEPREMERIPVPNPAALADYVAA